MSFLWVISLDIPAFDTFSERLVSKSTKIYDRTGKILLYDIYQDVKRQVVPFADISRHLKNATVAIEDSEFYQHRGVKPVAILRAFLVNLGSASIKQGGSTITQQLVKNSLLTQERRWSRKIKELVLALKLEHQMSKDEILGHYLNEIPYGGNLYGAKEAAAAYFGKDTKDLTLAEASYLAAMPKAPSFYSPYGNNRQKLEERKDLVLGRMAEIGFITPEEQAAAESETVSFLPFENRGIKAPHFVIWIRDYLEKKYGEAALYSRGLRVITTLDWPLEERAEAIVKQYAEENSKQFNAKNASLVAIDPKTGQVLAMVGSKDYFDVAGEGNFNVALAHRQPGSAFKPFAYAEAFKKGYTPETMLFDLETQFDTACEDGTGRCYKPTNYDNKFRGPVSLRQALAQSINIPSIKTLYLAGLADTLKLAKAMGIESLGNVNQYGLTLVLGGGEVSLLDLVSAYGVFANEGARNPYTGILRVENDASETLEEFVLQPRQVLDANVARLISDILSDNEARTPTFGADSPLHFSGRQVAAKTGTSNDYKDAWIIGYTPNFVAGAWAGNNDNTPMEKRVAGFIVAPLWRAFMNETLKNLPAASFTEPELSDGKLLPVIRGFWRGGQVYWLDKISGKLATEHTPPELKEERVLTEIHSILYWLGRRNDPQFKLWEEPVRRWAVSQNIREETIANLPKEVDDVHRPEYRPVVSLLAPDLRQIYSAKAPIRVTVNYQSRFPLGQLEYFLNDQYLGAVKKAPFDFSFLPADVADLKKDNTLRVVVRDAVGNKSELESRLTLSNVE